jgi:hypothetical protein
MTKKYMTAISVIWVMAAATLTEAKAQSLPDLIVRQVEITRDPKGLILNKIIVSVMNACGKANAGKSYVLVTFKENASPDARAIYFVGDTVRPLKGGETYALTFDVYAQKMGVQTFILIESDPYKKVAEANEENNWRTVNPVDAGTSSSPPRCTL